MILRHWFDSAGIGVEPGKIYAMLIAFADQQSPYSNDHGAGSPVLGSVSSRYWMAGTRDVANGLYYDVGIPVSGALLGSPKNLKVGIWWPEPDAYHNNIDFYLYDSLGSLRASGTSVGSVFERATVSGNLAWGSWTLRIVGTSVYAAPQKVYIGVYYEKK